MKRIQTVVALALCLLAPSPSRGQEPPAEGPKLICSLNGFFCAATDPTKNITIVFRRRAGGVNEPLWSMRGYFPVAFLSNDGEYLITGNPSGGVLPAHPKKNQVMISFYDRGRLLREVRLHELVHDISKLPRVGGQIRWGAYLGLNADDHLTVQMADQNWILFDARTGQALK